MRCCVSVRHGDVPSEAYGISVTPSGHLPSSLVRPSRSFLEGMLALPSALHMISLIILCRCCLPALFLQARPWRPLAVTLSLQLHRGGSHSIVPSRIPTAIRITSSDRRRPNVVTGGASNQSPVCGAREASRRAWSSALLADSCKIVHALFVQQLSHALWRWVAAPVGGSEPVCAIHASSAVLTSSSEVSADSDGSRFAWSSLVLAAEAKKAESASVAAERIPRPPCFSGRDAWSQFSSDSSTFKILDSPLLSSESNLARLGWSTQRAVRIV